MILYDLKCIYFEQKEIGMGPCTEFKSLLKTLTKVETCIQLLENDAEKGDGEIVNIYTNLLALNLKLHAMIDEQLGSQNNLEVYNSYLAKTSS